MSDRDERHFPLKRFLLLGALIGAGAYYLSREQNRRALDQKLAELGLKDAAGNVTESVTKGWEKTKDAATSAGHVIADKAAEVKDAVQQGGVQAGLDKAKEVAGEAKVAVTGATAEARDAARNVADAAKSEAKDVQGQVKDAAGDAQQAVNQARDKAQDLAQGASAGAQDAKNDVQRGANNVKAEAQRTANDVKGDVKSAVKDAERKM